jgi:WD40 repeat protein
VSVSNSSFFVTGGTLSASAASYIERAADNALYRAQIESQFCFVLNSRQMGKSSICVRTMERLEAVGVKTAFIDLTRIGGRNVSAEQWYGGIVGELGRTLELRTEMLRYWKEHLELGPMLRLFSALRDVVLAKYETRVAIFIDEIDATRTLPFDTDEFFAGIRECYNRRVQDPAFQRLSFCLLGVALPSDLIANPVSTPFNIGQRIYLKDFTLEEAQGFAGGISRSDIERGDPPRNAAALVSRVYYWTGGHPFLTQSVCQAVAASPLVQSEGDVDLLIKSDLLEPKARETNINLADVANRALNAGSVETNPDKFRADLLTLYQRALEGKPVADDESNRVSARLKLSGLMRSDQNQLYVRNRIYRHVFDRRWIRENMPGQEVRRFQRALFIGGLRVAFLASIVVGIISYLAISNYNLAVKAEYESYISQVNLMRTASQDHDNRVLAGLLKATSTSPFKGLEWSYWNAQLHNANHEADFPSGTGNAILSADARTIAIEDVDERKGCIYSLPDLKQLYLPVPLGDQQHFYPTKSGWMLVGTPDPHTVRFSDPFTGKTLSKFDKTDSKVWRTGSSSDGSLIVQVRALNQDPKPHDLFLWRTDTFQETIHCRVQERTIDNPKLNRNGTVVGLLETPTTPLSVEAKTVATVRSLPSGTLIDEYVPTGDAKIGDLGISPDGHLMACGLNDGKVIVRDIQRHVTIFERNFGHPGATPTFSKDNRLLLLDNSDSSVQLVDLKMLQIISDQNGSNTSCLDPSGNFIVVVGTGSRVYLSKDFSPPLALPSTAMIHGLAEDGNVVVTESNAVSYLDPTHMQLLPRGLKWKAAVSGLSPNGAYAVLPSKGDGSDVVDLTNRTPLFHIPYGQSRFLIDVSVQGDRFAIYSAGKNETRLFDRSGKSLLQKPLPAFQALNLSWAPDGNSFAISTDDGAITLFGRDGQLIRTLLGPGGWPCVVRFDPTSERLAAGFNTGRLIIYDLSNKSKPVDLIGHGNRIQNIQFTNDGKRMLTGARDGTVRLWDTSTGREVLRISVALAQTVSAAITKDESSIIVGLGGRTVKNLPLHTKVGEQLR